MNAANSGSRAATVFIVAGIVALAPAAWWVTGLVAPDGVGPYPDYLVPPIEISAPLKVAVGMGSLALVTLGAAMLATAIQRGAIHHRWPRVLLPLALLAVYSGFTYAVVTAPVDGANIGGGILLLATPPVGLALLATAAFQLRRLRGDRGARVG